MLHRRNGLLASRVAVDMNVHLGAVRLIRRPPRRVGLDVEQIEAAIGPRTTAILAPNLIGNCPDWDVIRDIADRHDLVVIEDSCDCLGATLRGTPTGARSDMSVTSFAYRPVRSTQSSTTGLPRYVNGATSLTAQYAVEYAFVLSVASWR